MRLKIERPGMGSALDENIADLVLTNKHTQAKKLCNDVLFASRSNQDRETANYWRTLLSAQEEIDAGNHLKAIDILKTNAKWWKSRAKDYHIKIVNDLVLDLQRRENVNETLQEKNKLLTSQVNLGNNGGNARVLKLEIDNQQMMENIIKLKAENSKLTQLLIDLETR